MPIVTEYASGASGTDWTGATNANADDGSYATYTIAAKSTTGNVNTLTNFGFDSTIPVGSTINSVELVVEHKVSTASGIANLECAVAISGTPGTYNTDGAEPTTDTQRTYSTLGRPGGGTWTRADLLDGTFTVLLRARSGNNATSVVYSWDYARVNVDYTIPAQTLTQSASFSDGDGLAYDHTVTPGEVALTQSSSYSNTNAFYAHEISQPGSGETLTQASRFDNSNTFYEHALAASITLAQSARFDNDSTLNYEHTLTPGEVALAQADRFDNTAGFYAATVTQPGAVAVADAVDTHDGFLPIRIPGKRRRREFERLWEDLEALYEELSAEAVVPVPMERPVVSDYLKPAPMPVAAAVAPPPVIDWQALNRDMTRLYLLLEQNRKLIEDQDEEEAVMLLLT